jgi:hypothetical protein
MSKAKYRQGRRKKERRDIAEEVAKLKRDINNVLDYKTG